MKLALIAAVARNGAIGRGNRLPWRLPDDMRHFMRTTNGCAVIMGRRTFESMSGPLPKRANIVVTRQASYGAQGVEVVGDFAAALKAAARHCARTGIETAFAIGGTAIYQEALQAAERLYITWVAAEVAGNAWFPEVDWRQWREISSTEHPADARHQHAFRIAIYERLAPANPKIPAQG